MGGANSPLARWRPALTRLAGGREAWRSPASVPRPVLTGAFVAAAGFAAGMALISTNRLHQAWALYACASYGAGALAVLLWKRHGADLALALSLAGALLVPLYVMVTSQRRQPEVTVIATSAAMLVHHGTPYVGPATLAATHNPNIFDPYLPLMTAFGLPNALLGLHILTDPRVWFGLGFVLVFAVSLALAGVSDVTRWTGLVTASPVIAFTVVVGGTDVPVLACQCLGLALLWRRSRPLAAGVALGAAAAMKATAWPALAVALILVLARDGRRPAVRMLLSALAVVAAIVGPVAALWPRALVQNTIEFPLGLASVRSDASSPLPGHLLEQTGPVGHTVAVVLLCLTALGLAVYMVARPPRTVPAATSLLIIGLTAMVVLAPATRFGYFLYPLGLFAWLGISRYGCPPAAPPGAGPPSAAAVAPPPVVAPRVEAVGPRGGVRQPSGVAPVVAPE